jgi:AcrR family transcriptional regulator
MACGRGWIVSIVEVKTRPRGSYAKSAAIRQRVLDACVEAFGISGFFGATMKDIAARAEISHTGLLHHFPTKESLLSAVLTYRDERSTKVFEAAFEQLGTTPESNVRSMLAAVAANELEPGLAALHSTLSAEATTPDHPAHDYFQHRYQKLRVHYEASFKDMADRGLLLTSMTPRFLAMTFIALLDGLQVQWLYEQDTFRMEDVIEDFLASISQQP